MNLQVIKSVKGRPEYVLLPMFIYALLREQIEQALRNPAIEDEYVAFNAADYVDNPVALARMKAHLSQQQLAQQMGVSQAYISKLEHQTSVTQKVLLKVKQAMTKLR